MGVFFALGSACFAAGPLSVYADAVGGPGDALTYFIGSILFTLGGASQCLLAAMTRWSGGRTRLVPSASWSPARSSTPPPHAAGCCPASIMRAGGRL
ncbi:MAG: hypothetical protein ACRDN0_31220 [Trebonia sp.]